MNPRKNVLITGVTGSLGSALVSRWYDKYNITGLSRDPHKQARLALDYPDVRYILADICNETEVRRACVGQDILIHAAALKDVSTGEFHPVEFSRVNVAGSVTIAQAWAKTHGNGQQGQALLISSDKAVNALNGYGADKKRAETIFRKYDYSVVRYGNVVSSAGSFVHKWQEAIERGEPLLVREPNPTRFLLLMDDAIDLIENALQLAIRFNGIFVPHQLKAFSIRDVAASLGATVKYQPLLPYEKQHEALVAEGEDVAVESDLLARIKPGGWSGQFKQYRSNKAQMLSGQEVLDLLGWQRD